MAKIKKLFSKFGDQGAITFAIFQDKIKSAEVKEYFQTLGSLAQGSALVCSLLGVQYWTIFSLAPGKCAVCRPIRQRWW